jgi:glycosyltransferase involved in cell wall biosynthesis
MRGIKYVSLHEQSGYGRAGLAYLRGLIQAGLQVTWQPMVPGLAWDLGYEPFTGLSVGDPALDAVLHKPIDYDTVILHTVPEYYLRWKTQEPGKTLVGYTVWETDQMKPSWRDPLEQMDLILVPTTWNKSTFENAKLRTPTRVIPHIFEPLGAIPGDKIRQQDRFRFYSIGAWTDRKASWQILETYWQTFSRADPVELILKTGWTDHTQFKFGRRWRYFGRYLHSTRRAVARLKRRYPDSARVKLITGTVSPEKIYDLHRSSDCYVSLPHSEGWGLGAFDAAGYGNPVITTNYGGPAEFLDPKLAYLVDCEPEPAGRINGRFVVGRWGRVDLNHAGHQMRTVFEGPAAAKARARLQGERIRSTYSSGQITQILLEALKEANRLHG